MASAFGRENEKTNGILEKERRDSHPFPGWHLLGLHDSHWNGWNPHNSGIPSLIIDGTALDIPMFACDKTEQVLKVFFFFK